MAKCFLCHREVNLEVGCFFSSWIRSELEKFGAYKSTFLGDLWSNGIYCGECNNNFSGLIKGTNVEEGCEYFKRVIAYNHAHKYINLKNFDKLVEHYYINHMLRIEIEEHIIEAKAMIERSVPSLVFPKLPENHHFCATRQGNNLVMYENFNPKFRYGENLKNTKQVFEDVNKKEDEELFMMTTIPLENILSYQLIGAVEHTAVVSGGGSGGQPNIRGAVMGGLLFGGAGAIIGSQTGVYINPIKSDVLEYDSRVTILNLRNDKGQAEIKELPYYYSEVFMKVIPEKEFSFIQAQNNVGIMPQGQNAPAQIQGHNAPAQIQAQNAPVRNMVEEIKQLKELLDLDLITQEEYDAKKKELLSL